MIRRSAAGLGLLFLLSASSFAQFTEEAKRDVLRDMGFVVTERAFVPGVDLKRWPEHLERRKELLERAQTPESFARVVNSALREFGISHINLRRSTDGGRGGSYLQQSPTPQQNPNPRPATDTIRWVDSETALVRIGSFGTTYQPLHVERLFREAAPAKRLILDLRSNGGGRVDYMRHLLSLMLPGDTPIGTFVTRRAAQSFVASGQGDGQDPIAIASWYDRKFRVGAIRVQPYEGDIAVLVNRGSASAAEITASALREVKGTRLVGTPTAGAVLMSTFQRLPHGFQIQYPLSDYVSIRGTRLEGNPLIPDVELSPAETRTEGAVEAALRVLGGDGRR
jgi:hypothetical protein